MFSLGKIHSPCNGKRNSKHCRLNQLSHAYTGLSLSPNFIVIFHQPWALWHSSDGVENLLFLLFVLHKHQGFIMIQDIKPGSQSTSPSLIILGQSIVYAEVVAKQTGPNRRNNRFSAPSDECLTSCLLDKNFQLIWFVSKARETAD